MSRERFTLSLLLGCALACGDDDDRFEAPLEVLGPVSTESSLVYVDLGRDELVFARPGDDAIEVSRVPIDEDDRTRVLWFEPTRDRKSVLALTAPSSDKHEDVDKLLFRFSAAGDGDPVVYPMAAPFNAVAQSPDHRRAVLYFSSAQSSAPLQNANQVAIVDLTTKEARNLTLNGFGGRLSSVHFPGQVDQGSAATVEVGGRVRELVAFLAEGEVVLVDMADPTANQVAVTFGDAGFQPVATMLRPGNDLFGPPVLFLRSSSGADVAMLTLVGHGSGDGFTTQISLIPVGTHAGDFVSYDGLDVPYLVTAAAGALVFTDIRTHESFEVGLSETAQRVFLRNHDRGGTPVRQIVAWAPGGTLLHTLDLDGIEHTLGRTPHELRIQTGIDDLVVLDNDRVLAGSAGHLYVVDFPADQVTPLTARVPYDATSSALDGNLLLLGTPGQSWLSTVDLFTLNPESMVLDDPIRSFHYLSAEHKLVVTHEDPVGHVTVARATDPSRATSYVTWGILLEGMLDHQETK
jgi:hypothetical protein